MLRVIAKKEMFTTHYYFAQAGNTYITHDSTIADAIFMSTIDYIRMMRKEFGAYFNDNNCATYFVSSRDAEKALEFINSRLLVRELIGKKY